MTQFSDFDLDPTILQALEKMGFKEPTAIQQETIPLIQQNHDVIALAQTGSGKTAACAIPICQRVDSSKKDIQALIVVPTRELATQYATEAQKVGKNKGVSAFAIYGGEDSGTQLAKIKHGVQVLIATPGRLIDFIYSRQINLSEVETLILDEADEMLSMGFIEDLEFIIQCLVHEHQTLLFSATMAPQIRKLAKTYMNDPMEVSLTQKQATPKNLSHRFYYCTPPQRDQVLLQLIKEVNPKQAIIFCQSRIQVEKVCHFLKKHLTGVDYLHGGMTQNLRNTITNKYRQLKLKILVATDVAARGLDFSHVSHVFIYQLHPEVDTYVHRAGRTGRQERKGDAISLVTKHELRLVGRIEKRIGQSIEWIVPPPTASNQGNKTPVKEASKEQTSARKPKAKAEDTPQRRRRRRPSKSSTKREKSE